MDFVDNNATRIPPANFTVVWRVPPTPPGFTVLDMATNTTLVRIDSASQPYTVGVSTNQGQLTLLQTNFSINTIQTAAASTIGNASMLTTFLTASQPMFLASGAFGMQGYSEMSNSVPANSWINFTFIKTNGQTVVVAVTNQLATNSSKAAFRQPVVCRNQAYKFRLAG